MSSRKKNIPIAKRDAIIADAVNRALYAMKLVNGITTESYGRRGTVQFVHEMARLEIALQLLSEDLLRFDTIGNDMNSAESIPPSSGSSHLLSDGADSV